MRSRISGPRCTRALGPLDPRLAPWRPDLADLALADRVAVPNYVRPAAMVVAVEKTPLLDAGSAEAVAASQLLHGEGFHVLDIAGGFAWGQSTRDGYVGHVAIGALAPPPVTDDARPGMIGPGDALLFAEPRVKAPVMATLPMAALVDVVDHDGRFVRLSAGPLAGLFLHRQHLLPPAGDLDGDWVAFAELFLGSPYRWGGRCRDGVDCSGLIQVARQLCGMSTPRDSDMQAADAKEAVAAADVRRGDIAFWPGHVGVMMDQERLLHANAHWMACVVELLADVIARAAAGDGPAEPVFKRW